MNRFNSNNRNTGQHSLQPDIQDIKVQRIQQRAVIQGRTTAKAFIKAITTIKVLISSFWSRKITLCAVVIR